MPTDALTLNPASTAWLLVSAALVMLMTPGLALFYGGMVRVRGVLNMVMMSFACLGIVTVLWVLYGYSLAFGRDVGWGLIGNLDAVGLHHVGKDSLIGPAHDAVPVFAFVMFQLMFAIITPALISGAVADRARFSTWCVFVALWVSIVYFPVAHWVFFFDGGHGGLLGDRLGALDFAGGTAVHTNAGAAALALVLVLGRRRGWGSVSMRPHNLPLVMLGAGLLWFGWFGFNAGSALAANGLAATALLNTHVSAATAMLGWLAVERWRDGKATSLGAASGLVAGLVAITPACASVDVWGAMAIGVIAGMVCAWAISWKYRLGYDDALDVIGVHLVGGIIGSLLIGLFATSTVTSGASGLLHGGGFSLLGKQFLAVAAVGAYSFVLTLALGFALERTIGFRLTPEHEELGADLSQHAEAAYDYSTLRAHVHRLGGHEPEPGAWGAASAHDPAPAPPAQPPEEPS